MPPSTSRNDPFTSFRFEVRLDDIPVAGFSECNGLQMEIDVHEYHEGGQNAYMLKLPGHTKQAALTLKRGIVDRRLWDWFYDLTQGKMKTRSGSIIVRDPSGQTEVMVWEFKNAFPAKWVGSDLNATQNSVAVETVDLWHQGLQRKK